MLWRQRDMVLPTTGAHFGRMTSFQMSLPMGKHWQAKQVSFASAYDPVGPRGRV